MQKKSQFSGVIAPVLTPFGEDGGPDAERFVEHCQWLMAEGCTGLAPFGTTSEGNSLGLDERMELLEELVDTGELDPAKLMPGTGTCSLADAIVLTKHAVEVGCGGVLMLPPFYYKAPSEDGLFRFFAETIEEVGDDRLKVYLYHIPPVAQVGFSLPLIGRLIKEFPNIVVGLKDSAGDLAFARDERDRAGNLIAIDVALDERVDALEPLRRHADRLGLRQRQVRLCDRSMRRDGERDQKHRDNGPRRAHSHSTLPLFLTRNP